MPLDQVPDDIDERRLSLGEHLEELRRHVGRAVMWIALAFAVCLCFQSQLMRVATWPHTHTMEVLRFEQENDKLLGQFPTRLVHRIDDIRKSMESLEVDARSLDRNAAILRTKLEKDPEARIRAMEDRRAELGAEIRKLQDEQDALLAAAQLDGKKAAELEEKRVALEQKVTAFTADVRRDVASMSASGDVKVPKIDLIQLRYTESVMAYLQVATVCALFLASPFVARELWKFVAAGLHRHEKKYVVTFAPLTFVTFLVGCAFGYFVLIPAGLKFLATYADDYIVGQFALSDYLSLFLTLTLAVGVMFELPLIMTFLALIGVFTADFYARYRRYWVLVAFVIAAIVSPTPDPVNQTICALPLLVLYEAGIIASRWATRGRETQRLAELAKRPPPPVPPPTYEHPAYTMAPPPAPSPAVPTPALGADAAPPKNEDNGAPGPS